LLAGDHVHDYDAALFISDTVASTRESLCAKKILASEKHISVASVGCLNPCLKQFGPKSGGSGFMKMIRYPCQPAPPEPGRLGASRANASSPINARYLSTKPFKYNDTQFPTSYSVRCYDQNNITKAQSQLVPFSHTTPPIAAQDKLLKTA
jgi:hypothetical protein